VSRQGDGPRVVLGRKTNTISLVAALAVAATAALGLPACGQAPSPSPALAPVPWERQARIVSRPNEARFVVVTSGVEPPVAARVAADGSNATVTILAVRRRIATADARFHCVSIVDEALNNRKIIDGAGKPELNDLGEDPYRSEARHLGMTRDACATLRVLEP
jgi:hypothetical protein